MNWSILIFRAPQPSVPYFDGNIADQQSVATRLSSDDFLVLRWGQIDKSAVLIKRADSTN
jgi:hypothetical protein